MISSIGFETNPGTDLPMQQPLGDKTEVSFDGKVSGWIKFK